MEIADTIRVLITKRMKDEVLTGPEEKQLEEWLNASSENQKLYDKFMNPESFKALLKEHHTIITSTEAPSSIEAIVSEPNNVIALPAPKRSRFWMVAASLILLSGTLGFIYFFNRPSDKQTPDLSSVQQKNIETPGGNKALLTLADGSQIILDDAHNGAIAEQEGTSIRKQQDGQLLYVAPNSSSSSPSYVKNNTVSTPRGGQYEVHLPDGTTVWLNAASSISFPVAFTGKERLVTVSGELYFEVAKDAHKPFIVKIAGAHGKDASITVLGTHFNVSAYPDEDNIMTTLLEGSVKVTTASATNQLKPGQAASVDNTGSLQVIKQANTEQAIAWKNGSFVFANQDIGTIMRQIGRWYDLDVVIKGKAEDKYYGEISKFKQLRDVLHLLEQYGIAFELDAVNRQIVVKP